MHAFEAIAAYESPKGGVEMESVGLFASFRDADRATWGSTAPHYTKVKARTPEDGDTVRPVVLADEGAWKALAREALRRAGLTVA